MFKKVIINSFRGINNLEIDDLKRVNLFVGKNNCGKTSVLEGIYLLSNPLTILNLIDIRNFENFKEIYKDSEVFNNALLTIFNKINTNIPIKISGYINSHEMKELIINYMDGSEIKYDENIGGFPIGGLRLNYTTFKVSDIKNVKVYEISIWEGRLKKVVIKENNNIKSVVPLPTGVRISRIMGLAKEQKSIYLSPKIDISNIVEWINKLQISKEIDKIIEILQKIEPSIKDLRIGAEGIIYCDIEAEKLIPINVMGDGILKLLIILSAIYNAKDGFVFIDEIENGLHYTSLEILWRGIFEASKKFNVQLFATTHSWECIKAYIDVYENMKSKDIDIMLYRIERYNNEFKAIDYDKETLKEAINMEWEMR
ncbi:MAG: AAA family ATPase [Methanococci archaeon]|nr:AAA family ATPase [Methanococci archaeon]